MRYFVAVAEELHFGRAAAREKVAASTLGEQIAALEKDIGGQLVHRTTRRVRLTAAGQVLLPQARRVLGAAERALQAARLAVAGQLGVLRLGVPMTGNPCPLDGALRSCSQLYPGLRLDQHPGYSAQHAAALLDDRLDAAFIYGGPAGDGELGYERLVDVELLLACPSNGSLARQDHIDFDRVVGAFVALDAAVSPALNPAVIAGACHVSEADVTAVGSLEAVLLAVANGAVALMPEAVTSTLSWRGVCYRRLGAPAPTVELGIAWPAGDQPPMVRCLLQAASADDLALSILSN